MKLQSYRIITSKWWCREAEKPLGREDASPMVQHRGVKREKEEIRTRSRANVLTGWSSIDNEQVEERDFSRESISLSPARSLTLSFTGTFMCTLKEEISNRYLLSICYMFVQCVLHWYLFVQEKEKLKKSGRERKRERAHVFWKTHLHIRASSLRGRPVPAMTLIPKQTNTLTTKTSPGFQSHTSFTSIMTTITDLHWFFLSSDGILPIC